MFLLKKNSFIILITILFFLIVVPAGLAASAPGIDSAKSGLDATATNGGLKTGSTITDLPIIIGNIIGAALAFTGAIFFALVLWAGMGWMLAKGDEQKITESKETIIGAVLGLIVVLGAYAITKVIATIITNATK